MEYEKGTQEQLDAAKRDATLLPFGTLFKSKVNTFRPDSMPNGVILLRGLPTEHSVNLCDDPVSVAFKMLDDSDFWYVDAADLEPIND